MKSVFLDIFLSVSIVSIVLVMAWILIKAA